MSTITVYHGSTARVEHPLTKTGRENLDFGQGFYVTRLRQQAIDWATRLSNDGQPQWLNVYQLDIDRVKQAYRCLSLDQYNRPWLDFIVANRRGQKPWQAYDFVEGGVANDRVVVAVELYYRRQISARRALGMLAHHDTNNQMCLLSQPLVDECLHFTHCEPLNALAAPQPPTPEGGAPC